MRIAYVINSIEGGGAALPVPSIVEVLRKGGAEVKIFALTRRDGRALPAFAAADLNLDIREGGERDHLPALLWLDRAVRAWRPTHLWTSLTRATLLGQIIGWHQHIPVVSWQHAASLKPTNDLLLRSAHRRSRLWIGDSETVTRITGERFGIGGDRLMRWPIFRANPEAPRARAWNKGDVLRIGSLGRLHRVKGYDVLVDALARLRKRGVPHEVLIAGDGRQREAIEARARAAGITSLKLTGYTDDPQSFLASLHVYVQPSRSEGMCMAAHEAMQAGLPVIASAVGELPHSIIDGVTGWTMPPGDPVLLAKRLDELLNDPDRLAEMGRKARDRLFDRFDPGHFEASGLAIVDRMRSF